MDYVMKVSKIKLLRIEKGIKLWELAAAIGVSETMLSKIENKRICPKHKTLLKISSELGVEMAALIDPTLDSNDQ
jgi:transcriptional regulator with XRE-family HTH domain